MTPAETVGNNVAAVEGAAKATLQMMDTSWVAEAKSNQPSAKERRFLADCLARKILRCGKRLPSLPSYDRHSKLGRPHGASRLEQGTLQALSKLP